MSDGYLVASLIWSTLGVAIVVWGRKMGEIAPVVAGVALVAVSWFIDSPLSMSLTAVAIMVVMRYAMRRGY